MEQIYKEKQKRRTELNKFLVATNYLLCEEDKQKISEILLDYNIITKICSECGKIITVGYDVDNGEQYYCSDKCLKQNKIDENTNNVKWKEWGL